MTKNNIKNPNILKKSGGVKILIIDNYDSFTYNLYQYVGEILESLNKKFELTVKRNDEITIEEINDIKFDKIIISPGPGNPDDSKYFGVCYDVITKLKTTPILGVCLGLQGIVYCFGGKIIQSKLPMHGKTSLVTHNEKGLFENIPQNIEVMRYHSLIADPSSIPDCLEVTATVKDNNEIMGVRHKDYPIAGVQFHPESFATEGGKEILENFINL